MSDQNTNPLVRFYGWFEKPGSLTKSMIALGVACLVVVGWDFTYEKYGYFAETATIGFYAGFGFTVMLVLILAARGWQVIVRTRENYFGDECSEASDFETGAPRDEVR
ncbi:MAG: hypothetical protein AAF826_11115 [Pseudomonadota bacterium]